MLGGLPEVEFVGAAELVGDGDGAQIALDSLFNGLQIYPYLSDFQFYAAGGRTDDEDFIAELDFSGFHQHLGHAKL